MRRALAILLLPFVLLFAQQAALAHGIQHLGDRAAGMHKTDAGLPGDQSCEQCFVFAHLGGATVAHVFTPAVSTTAIDALFPAATPVLARRTLSPPSRGPPRFL